MVDSGDSDGHLRQSRFTVPAGDALEGGQCDKVRTGLWVTIEDVGAARTSATDSVKTVLIRSVVAWTDFRPLQIMEMTVAAAAAIAIAAVAVVTATVVTATVAAAETAAAIVTAVAEAAVTVSAAAVVAVALVAAVAAVAAVSTACLHRSLALAKAP